MDKYYGVYYFICIVWCLTFIGMTVYLYLNNSRPYPSKFKEKYYPKIPSNLNPGELSNLIYKKVFPEVFTSTIMVLVKKDILTLRRHKDECFLTLNQLEPKLSLSQKIVLNILINDMGDGEKVTFKQIEEYSKSPRNRSEFLINYHLWTKMIIKESNKKNFYEAKTQYSQVKSMRTFGIILFLINIIFNYHSLIGYAIIVPAFFIVLYFYKIYKRTESANEEYNKWIAFKRYLEHIDEFEYPKEDIASYIIYGLVLKMPDLEKKLTDFHCVEKLNNLINHNIVIANLKGNRRFRS